VVSSSGISESEFYAVFESFPECVCTAYDQGVARIARLVEEATSCAHGWHDRVQAALSALLVFFDDEPGWACLLLDESRPDAEQEFERRQQPLQPLARVLVTATQAEKESSAWFVPRPELTAELVIGGIASVLRTRIHEARHDPLVEMAPSLMAFIIAHYPGLSANMNAQGTGAATSAGSQLQRLPVRVTYRTTRVLAAIGDSPGLSNRDIAESAGLTDEGQTSRLLRRLEQRGLVENVGLGHTHGGANAWLLTPYGERVLAATRHSLVPDAGAVVRRRARGAA
jgi:DNA-binding MarR family transcriptional regulator